MSEPDESRQAPESQTSDPVAHGGVVPVSQLIDLERLTPGREPTLRELRAALPRGWVLEPDGKTARRDLRLFFREGWILLLGLSLFGAGAVVFFVEVLPGGWTGIGRLALYAVVIALVAGWVAPMITRALYRR